MKYFGIFHLIKQYVAENFEYLSRVLNSHATY